ncbi:CAMK/CAMK1 protein kinase [Phytophthora cinnamomi]|uniref:CAMK/CAMK1 protein kinase n=1 Tax=Phytophthora cinnamomi TaxID=4785 RepID=UPI003559D025|nr:CAMK/CAMK1 protein kinase [Phytophthora cinnamomi]
MGNSPLSREFSGRRLSSEEREATKRFGDEDMRLLRETFKGLASSKDGISMGKETFLKRFPMRELLGERLFEVIDKGGSGSIHYKRDLPVPLSKETDQLRPLKHCMKQNRVP